MNIYTKIEKDLTEVNATPRQAHLAFVALQLSGVHYLKYIEQLRERRKQEAADAFVQERYGDE